MKTVCKAAVLALAFCASFGALGQSGAATASGTKAAAPAAAKGVPFSSSDAKFAVSFPAQPKESQREDKTADGRAVVIHFAAVEDGPRYFATSWVQMTPKPRDKAARNRVLESAAGGALKSIPGGALVSKKKILVGKTAGLEYVIDAPKDAQRLRQRVFVAGDKLVQQIYSGPKGSENDASVKQFVASLKFLP